MTEQKISLPESVKTTKAKSKSSGLKRFIFDNIVTIVFVVLCFFGILLAKQPAVFLLNELVVRIARNSFMVLSLIIPVLAGMGLNFGIVIGAMAGQIALVAVTHWKIVGLGGFMLTILISTPIAVLFGWLTGKILNKTKGQEMITSMILGFFAMGLYQFLFLFMIGTVIPMNNPTLVLSGGVGIKNTIDLNGGVLYALDGIYKTRFFPAFAVFSGVAVIFCLYKIFKIRHDVIERVKLPKYFTYAILAMTGVVLSVAILNSKSLVAMIKFPVFTMLSILMLCAFNLFIVRTKMGQDFRTVGQDMHVAKISGINVNRVRIISIMISTVFAAWGQLIFLQNIGTLNTYGSHEQVGMFAVASILIGGASVNKATIGQAILGTTLFHLMFIISPFAGKNLFGNAQIGEYFRVFVAYGVIGVSLGLHAWKTQVQAKRDQLGED
jgi:simple sugar transport system permease protein